MRALRAFGSAVAWGTRGPVLYPKGSAHIFGAAMGARIKLIVDMNQRSLSIQVRGQSTARVPRQFMTKISF